MSGANIIDILVRQIAEGSALKDAAKDLGGVEEGAAKTAQSMMGSIDMLSVWVKIAEAVIEFEAKAIKIAGEVEYAYAGVGATITSMGLSTEISTGQIKAMADQLAELAAFDSSNIAQASEAFLRIENFDTSKMQELLKVTMDYAAGSRKDIIPAAQQVALALETGQTRSLGFSAAIRKQVQEMVKAGDSAGALALIMETLNSKYGGQAAAQMDTYIGKQEKLTLNWENFMATVGGENLEFGKGLLDYANDIVVTMTQALSIWQLVKQNAADNGASPWVRFIPTAGPIIQMIEYIKSYRELVNGDGFSSTRIDSATQSYIGMAQAAQTVVTEQEQIVYNMDAVSEAAVKAGISGKLEAGFSDLEAQMARYRTNIEYFTSMDVSGPTMIAQLTLEIEQATAAYGPASEQVANLTDKMDKLQDTYNVAGLSADYWTNELNGANAEMERLTANFIYQQVAAKMDAETQLEAARALGLLSEADYNAAAAVMTLTDAYDANADGIINQSEKSDEYVAKLKLIQDAIIYLRTNNQPITQELILDYIETHYVSTVDNSSGVKKPTYKPSTPMADGGPVGGGGSYIWNENPATRPEVFVSGGGYILTKQDAQSALAGGRVEVNLTYAPLFSAVDETELVERLQPFLEAGIRQASMKRS